MADAPSSTSDRQHRRAEFVRGAGWGDATERLLAGDDLADDGDVFPGAGKGFAVGHAVPAFDHLRAGGADAAEEAVAGEGLEGHRGHGDAGRRAGGHLHDAGARVDLGRPPAPAAPDRLPLGPPFPPAAQRCALTDVLSTLWTSTASSLTEASAMRCQTPSRDQRAKRL